MIYNLLQVFKDIPWNIIRFFSRIDTFEHRVVDKPNGERIANFFNIPRTCHARDLIPLRRLQTEWSVSDSMFHQAIDTRLVHNGMHM